MRIHLILGTLSKCILQPALRVAALKILVKIKRVIRRVMTVERTSLVAHHEIRVANLNRDELFPFNNFRMRAEGFVDSKRICHA